MAKIDRQLDRVWGEGQVRIDWPADEEVDVDLVRLYLISEIDRHDYRIPVDLRGVQGAPEELIDLLVEMQRYARDQAKYLSISNSLPPMQEALHPRRRRAGRKQTSATTATDAGESARTVLDSQYKEEPYSIEESKVVRKPKKRKSSKTQRKRSHYLRLGGLILAVTGAIAVVEWYFIFHAKSDGVVVRKTFEGEDATDGP